MNLKNDFLSGGFATCAFSVLTLLIFINIGLLQHLHDRPNSTHTWAQCDRASVAASYYYENMNFFLPRVYNRGSVDDPGITGMEFPLLNYIAAVLYKLFGFDEAYYRLTSFLFLFIGLIFAFKLAYAYLKDYFLSAGMVWLFMLSPVVVFYSTNFLPDAASLGLVLIAWYLFFRLDKPRINGLRLLLFFTVLTLSCLIKISSAVNLVAMILLILSRNKLFRDVIEIPKPSLKIFILFFLVSGCLFGWYIYAAWLSRTYENYFFIMATNTIKTRLQLNEMLHNAYYGVYKEYYPKLTKQIILFAILLFAGTFSMHRRHLAVIFLLLLSGFLVIVFLLLKQFELHDYYIITILPVIFFLFLSVFDFIQRKILGNKWIRIVTIGLLFIAVNMTMVVCKKQYQHDRYKEGYRKYGYSSFDKYGKIEPYLDSIGVKKNDLVISYSDFTPNVSLYLMNRRGATADRSNVEWLLEDPYQRGFKYLVLGDTMFHTKLIFRNMRTNKIGEKNGIWIYKLDNDSTKN